MSLVRIGDKKVKIGGEGYKPTEAEIKEIGIKIGVIKPEDVKPSETTSKEAITPRKSLIESGLSFNPMSPMPALNPVIDQLQGMYMKNREGLLDTPQAQAMVGGLSDQPGNIGPVQLPSQRQVGRFAQGVGIDVAAGLGASKAVDKALLPMASKAANAVMNNNFKLPNFGGDKAFRKVAVEAKRQLNKASRQFEAEYQPIMERVGDKPVPHNMIDSAILDGVDQVPNNSQAATYLDKLTDQIDGATFKQLHALKGKVFKTAKSLPGTERNAVMKVYDAINDTLSGMDEEYSDITTRFSSFMRNESNYVRDKILDKFKNLTGAKLAAKDSLKDNSRTAFEALAKRTGRNNLAKDVDAIKTGSLIKKAGLGALGIAGAEQLVRRLLPAKGQQ